MILIQRELFDFARRGDLLVDYEVFKVSISQKLECSGMKILLWLTSSCIDKQLRELIDKSEDLGIIH